MVPAFECAQDFSAVGGGPSCSVGEAMINAGDRSKVARDRSQKFLAEPRGDGHILLLLHPNDRKARSDPQRGSPAA